MPWLLSSNACQSRSKTTNFLTLPLEVRLLIYSLVISTAQCDETPFTYFNFTLLDTGNPDLALCRSGFRKWDHRKHNAIYAWSNLRWPERDTNALSSTCRRIYVDLRDEFHPGRVALRILDDSLFNLCAGEALYAAISERAWLYSRLEIVRLDIGGREQPSKLRSESIAWRTHHHLKLAVTAAIAGSRRRTDGPDESSRALAIKSSGLTNLAHKLKSLPKLRKFELFLRFSDGFHDWVDPLGDVEALQSTGVKLCIIRGPALKLEDMLALITSHGGKWKFSNGRVHLRGNPTNVVGDSPDSFLIWRKGKLSFTIHRDAPHSECIALADSYSRRMALFRGTTRQPSR